MLFNDWKALTIFGKISMLDVWQVLNTALSTSEISEMNSFSQKIYLSFYSIVKDFTSVFLHTKSLKTV